MKYRNKSVIVDAIQWNATTMVWDKIQQLGLGGKLWDPGEMGTDSFYINSAEGKKKCKKGDWFIKDDGGFFVYKKEDFEKTFEPVEEATISELTEFSKNNQQ